MKILWSELRTCSHNYSTRRFSGSVFNQVDQASSCRDIFLSIQVMSSFSRDQAFVPFTRWDWTFLWFSCFLCFCCKVEFVGATKVIYFLYIACLFFVCAVFPVRITVQRWGDGGSHCQWADCRVYRTQGGEVFLSRFVFSYVMRCNTRGQDGRLTHVLILNHLSEFPL